MDNFIKTLEKTREVELEKLKQTLAEKKKLATSQMQAEIENLENRLSSHNDKQKQLLEQQKKYQKIKTTDFAELSLKDEIAFKIISEVAEEIVSKAADRKKWLQSGLDSIKSYNKGEIHASESLTDLKKLKSKHSIKKGDSINSHGFIFTNDSVEVDYSLDNFVKSIFRNNRGEIFDLLFS